MRKLLMASLGLNLFLAGMVVAPHMGTAPDFAPPPMGMKRLPGGLPFFGPALDQLPAADADKLRAIFKEDREAAHARREQMRAVMNRAGDILKTEKPDLESLQKVLDEARQAGESMHEGMNRALRRVATELPWESRQKLVDAMKRAHPPEGNGPPPPPPGE